MQQSTDPAASVGRTSRQSPWITRTVMSWVPVIFLPPSLLLRPVAVEIAAAAVTAPGRVAQAVVTMPVLLVLSAALTRPGGGAGLVRATRHAQLSPSPSLVMKGASACRGGLARYPCPPASRRLVRSSAAAGCRPERNALNATNSTKVSLPL